MEHEVFRLPALCARACTWTVADVFTADTSPNRSTQNSSLVSKDVWESLLAEDSANPSVVDEESTGSDPAHNLLGGYKRPRAAVSLSSMGSGDMNFLTNSTSMNGNGEELVNVFSSLDLSQLLQSQGQGPPGLSHQASGGDASQIGQFAPAHASLSKLPEVSRDAPLLNSGGSGALPLPAGLALPPASASPAASKVRSDFSYLVGGGQTQQQTADVSFNSDDMNAILEAAFHPSAIADSLSLEGRRCGSEPAEARALAAHTASKPTAPPQKPLFTSQPKAGGSDQRPLWRSVLMTVEKASTLLTKQPVEVGPLQTLLAQVTHEMIPKLNSLGETGVICQQRLAALMQEVGLAPGAPQPKSAPAVVEAASQAFSALKGYAMSGMLAPTVMPMRTGGIAVAAEPLRERAAPLERQKLALEQDDEGNGREGEGEAGDDGTPKLHACKNCQRAKTACNDQRPCARCVRLGIPCDGDMRAVKRACAACKRSKVKCDLDDKHPNPCTRCTRLGCECTPHVPNKKKKAGGDFSFGGGASSPEPSPDFLPAQLSPEQLNMLPMMAGGMLPPCQPCVPTLSGMPSAVASTGLGSVLGAGTISSGAPGSGDLLSQLLHPDDGARPFPRS